MVRLVWLQSRQQAIRARCPRHRPRLSFNTTIVACSAGLTALFISYYKTDGKWDLALTVNGFLAGLVAITCPCYWVDPEGAFLLRDG